MGNLFSQMLLCYFWVMAWPVQLSFVISLSVTLSYRTLHRGLNRWAPPNSLGTQTVCLKILEGVLAEVQLNGRGMKN